MLTPFGKTLRKLRLDRDMSMLDMANNIGLSSVYVSAVETGRKSLHEGYVKKVIEVMNLTDSEESELKFSMILTNKNNLIKLPTPKYLEGFDIYRILNEFPVFSFSLLMINKNEHSIKLIYDYVEEIRKNIKVNGLDESTDPGCQNTPVICNVFLPFTKEVEDECRYLNLITNLNTKGVFGFNRHYGLYINIVDYSELRKVF